MMSVLLHEINLKSQQCSVNQRKDWHIAGLNSAIAYPVVMVHAGVAHQSRKAKLKL